MKQDSTAWKFGTHNLVAICTLALREILEYFLKSILGKLYYIFQEIRNPMLQMMHESKLK